MDVNLTDEELLFEWNRELASYQIPNVVMLLVYTLTGVIGNGVVIYGYTFKMKGKKEDRYFIPSLAIIDIVACLIASGNGVYFLLFPVRFDGTSGLCKFMTFSNMAATTASGLMLCVIAVQRYLKVCRPFSRQMTLFWKRIALMATIFSGLAFSVPCLFFYGRVEVFNQDKNITGISCIKYPPGQELGKWAILYVVITSTSAIMCTLSAMGLYGLILRTIYKSSKMRESFKRKNVASAASSDTSSSDKETKMSFLRHDSARERQAKEILDHTSVSGSVRPVILSDKDSIPDSPIVSSKSKLRRQKSGGSTKSGSVKSGRGNTGSVKRSVKSHFAKHRYSWMFMTLTGIFIVSFAPWHALTIQETINPSYWMEQSNMEKVGLLFLYRLYILNHVANPFIYGLFDGAFRKVIRNHILSCTTENRNKRVSVV